MIEKKTRHVMCKAKGHSFYNTCFANGFSLLEVLFAMGILSLLMVGIFMGFDSAKSVSSDSDRIQLLDSILSGNIAEIETKDITTMPTEDTCLMRTYSFAGDLKNELTSPISNCEAAVPAMNEFIVSWLITNSSTINATFSHSNFMKLPTRGLLLLNIQVLGSFISPKDKTKKTFSLTFFKR